MDLKNYKIKNPNKITSERAELLKEFLEILNADRIKNGYPPLKPARLGMLLRYTSTKQLYTFLADCKYAKNFSAYFWWCFKQSK